MRVLQFAKRPVVTVALVCATLAGCGGESSPDAPFNPSGTSADLEAMNSTFTSPTFASFSTFSVMFDAALGGAPIIASSAAALDIHGKTPASMRAAAVRSATRMAALISQKQTVSPRRRSPTGISASMASVPPEVAGKTFVYDAGTAAYVASGLSGAPSNGARFILYAVDPVTSVPVEPLTETGHVDLVDLSGGSTQAARIMVVSGSTTYIDYTASASSSATSGRVSVVGYITDGVTQANINVRTTLSYTAGLTLTYSLDLPQRDVSIDLTLNASDIASPSGTMVVNFLMEGPNGSISMTGQFTDTNGTLNVRINGHGFATIVQNGSTTTITRDDGEPLAPEENMALGGVFEMSVGAFAVFDLFLAPVGALFDEPTT